MTTVTGKVWGITRTRLQTPLVELHHIVVNPHSHCSLHAHRRKWNCFLVIAGTLYIDVHKNAYDLVDTTVLHAGDMTTIEPGEFHKFRTEADGAEAYELYYLDPLGTDIERRDVGGSKS